MLEKIIVLLFAATCCCSSKVPVLMWSQSRPLNDIPQSHAGKTVQTTEFAQDYLAPLTSGKIDNLVVFLTEKLSLQDFTQYADVYNPSSDGGAFKNVRQFMDDHFSVHLPSVVSPSSALQQIQKNFNGKVHEVKNVNDLSQLDLHKEKGNLIIVTLSPVEDAKNEEDVFTGNDKQISEAVQQLKKRGLQYSAIYTARSSLKMENSEKSVKRRLLAEADAGNYTLINVTGCMYFYFRSFDVRLNKDGRDLNLTYNGSLTVDTTNSKCDNNSAVLNMKMQPNEEITVTLNFDIDGNGTEWKILTLDTEVTGTFNGTSFDGIGVMNTEKLNLWAPKAFSYHCSTLGPIHNTSSNASTVNVTLLFDGFQLQPFNIVNDQFSDGWDCVPFFTEGIWMGIVSMFVLISILMYGFMMITTIKTMDKFDDAKGKTITVNVNE